MGKIMKTSSKSAPLSRKRPKIRTYDVRRNHAKYRGSLVVSERNTKLPWWVSSYDK